MKVNKDLDYDEYLSKTQKEPRGNELNDMEKVFCKTSVVKSSKKPLNNPYYQPYQGS